MGSVRTGLDAVTTTARKLPGVVRKAAGRDGSGQSQPPLEYVIVEALPDALKECYLSVLVWLVHFDDGQIDERELCEMQVLMTQVGCKRRCAAGRSIVLGGPTKPGHRGADRTDAGIRSLGNVRSDAGREVLTHQGRDSGMASYVRRLRREDPSIRELAGLLELDDEKVAFIEKACVRDEAILAGAVSDSQIASAAKEMASHAASVGVPIAAVYLSGSVTGLSAAGIVSGLAALGLGGVLGLSAMVTGFGVAIVAGGAAYKGVQWALSGSERSKASRRELMLQEVLRIHQGAILHLAEDISFFGQRVAILTSETDRNRGAIDLLSREVALLSGSSDALTRLGERASGFERALQEEAASRATP